MKLAFNSPMDAKHVLKSMAVLPGATIESCQRSAYFPVMIEHTTQEAGAIVEHDIEPLHSPLSIEYFTTTSFSSADATSEESVPKSMPLSPTLINGREVNVLTVHEVVDYVIPSFSIITVKLRHATVTFGESSNQVDIFLNEKGNIPNQVPFSLKVSKECAVKVCLSLDTYILTCNIIDNM